MLVQVVVGFELVVVVIQVPGGILICSLGGLNLLWSVILSRGLSIKGSYLITLQNKSSRHPEPSKIVNKFHSIVI